MAQSFAYRQLCTVHQSLGVIAFAAQFDLNHREFDIEGQFHTFGQDVAVDA